MKVKILGMQLEGRVSDEAVIGQYTECMGHSTSFQIGDVKIADDRHGNLSFPLSAITEGAEFRLGIPSGGLFGRIIRTDRSDNRIVIFADNGEWEGKEGGLVGGLSCLFRFHPETLGEVTQSSLLPLGASVPYEVYRWAKDSRIYLAPKDQHNLDIDYERGDEIARELIQRYLANAK